MPDITANGISLHYESIGDPADPPLLLIMGLGVQMILWPDEFCRQLASQGFRVIRFDNRDVGLSTHLDHLGVPNIALAFAKFVMHLPVASRYSLTDMADDTAALLDALGIARAHLVGASMGGMIAQTLAVRHPERIRTLTSIMSTTGRRSLPRAHWRALTAIMSPPPKRDDVDGAIARMMRVLRTIGSRSHPASDFYLRDLCTRHVLRSNHPAGAARQLAAIAAADDRTKMVQLIRAPTLVLHGDEDPLIPAAAGVDTARSIRDGGGDARCLIVPGMGHDLPVPLWPQLVGEIVGHARGYPL